MRFKPGDTVIYIDEEYEDFLHWKNVTLAPLQLNELGIIMDVYIHPWYHSYFYDVWFPGMNTEIQDPEKYLTLNELRVKSGVWQITETKFLSSIPVQTII